MEDIIFCNKEEIKIKSDAQPRVCARTILPIMTQNEIKEIEKKPFLNKRDVYYTVNYKGEEYVIYIPKGYTWDAMTIPRFAWSLVGLSKENVCGLIASCVHDKITECKYLIDYNRKLSTLIFKELCIASNMPEWKANFISFFVDNFQKCVKGWKK